MRLRLGYRYIGLRDKRTAVFETERGSQVRVDPKYVVATELTPWGRKEWQVLTHVLGMNDGPIQSVWQNVEGARAEFDKIDYALNGIEPS